MATSYTNPSGSGDRTLTVLVRVVGVSTSNAWRLVNGVLSESVLLFTSTTGCSLEFWFPSKKIIDEATFYQQLTSSHGTWQWQGSNDRTTWTDLGATFTLGGVATQTLTTLAGNTTAYLFYRVLQVSGVTSASTYLYEFEFKIDEGGLTSYLSPLGRGDRTGTMGVTSSGITWAGSGGSAALINGALTNQIFWNASAVAGHWIAFDLGDAYVIQEARFYFSGAGNEGNWTLQGSPDGSAWTDLSDTVTLAVGHLTFNSALVTRIGGFVSNVTPYRYYRLLGVSGTRTATPFEVEVEFMVAATPGGFPDTSGLAIQINGVDWRFRAGSMTIHSTLNGRDTLSGIIDILDGSDPPLLNQDITVDEDGVRIYGGTINELEYRAITSDPDASKDLMVSLSAEDFNALADKRTVASLTHPGGLTLKEALEQLVTELTTYGVTLSPTQVDGPILPSFAFTLQTATAILDELSKLTEFVWEIDSSKVLTMWQPGSVAAPFNLTDGDGQVWGDIVITPNASDYANRIIVRAGGDAPTENVFAWQTDGVTNAFPMYLHVLQHFGQVLVDTPLETVPGEGFESVGAPGSGALWEFHDGPPFTQYLSRTAGPPPAGNPYPIVPYPLQFRVIQQLPLIVTADDLAEQAAHGIVEKLVDQGPNVSSWWELQAIADGLLGRHAARRYTIQYATRQTGLRVGQSQTITIARRNLSGPYFITDVDTQMVGATILKRTITATEIELYQGSWRDLYKLWAATSGGTGGGSVAVGTEVTVGGTPVPHHAQHEPGGMDPMTVDSTPSIGSLRTLGTGANQAAPGNDARFTTLALHHATHEPGGTDVLQLTATARLLGRATAGAGAVEELTIGDNLFLSGTTLNGTSRNTHLVNYSFSALQVAPPGTNQIRFDAGYPYTAVTTVWMAIVSADGQDVYRGLLIVPTGSTLLVQDKNDHTQYAIFTTTGAPVDHTTYVEFPVVHQAHGSSIGGGQLVLVQNTGAPAGAASLTTQQKTRAITVVFGTGSAVITAGLKTYVSCPYTGTITAARLLAVDASVTSGSIVIDVWKDTYAAFPPTVGDTITASAKPTLSSATRSDDTTLTGWVTTVTAGDVFGFVVDSASTVTQVALQLTLVVA